MPDEHQRKQTKSVIDSLRETVESLVLAFILAFVFRAFVVEAFVIPTGSMADTLRGDHFRLTCGQCGHQYNYGFLPGSYGYPHGYMPNYAVSLAPKGRGGMRNNVPICPFCGHLADTGHLHRPSHGDRILVLKFLYQFTGPSRWDVVVFKNPIDPDVNFIKRLVGRPEETIELIDGDVYIDGIIQSKPAKAQESLWLVAFNGDYQPRDEVAGVLWKQPFRPEAQSAWRVDQRKRVYEFEGSAGPDVLAFDPQRLRNVVQNFCAYNGPRTDYQSVASDLKLTFVLTRQGEKGTVFIKLGKYNRVYTAEIGFDGTCKIIDEHHGRVLAEEKFGALAIGRPIEVSFANVDHRFELRLGEGRLTHRGPNLAEQWGYDRDKQRLEQMPSVAVSGLGEAFSLKHVVLYRDTHYSNMGIRGRGLATEGLPFKLGKDEFFVLGDNSPASHDSRFWEVPGKGNGDVTYRQGTVPRDYLIGRALFVYWPAGFHAPAKSPVAYVPNVGEMRFIR